MTNIKTILVNFGVLALLVFGIMSFILITQVDNNVSIRITNNTLINESYGDLESQLLSSQAKSQDSLHSFDKVTPVESIGDLNPSNVVSAVRTSRTIIVGMWNIYIKLPMVILGVSPGVASIISTIILIFIIIGGWAIYKGAIQ